MSTKKYVRYVIETKKTLPIVPYPHRFLVKVKKWKLASLLLKEFFRYRGNKKVIASRPCIYGVFSGPIGGFSPREKLCVGCLCCTTEYPEVVQISHNPNMLEMGNDFLTPVHINQIMQEAKTGKVPIKGAGYRGKFGGDGWDGMWTDMSEIVRPTRDGIHGREYISTEVDIGGKPLFVSSEKVGTISQPIPIIIDLLPLDHPKLFKILEKTAQDLQTAFFLSFENSIKYSASSPHIIPVIDSIEEGRKLGFVPAMIAMKQWRPALFKELQEIFPENITILRAEFEVEFLLEAYQAGVRVFHLFCDEKGRSQSGRFVLDLIRQANQTFVGAGCRDQITLMGSGGIVAAEHMAKAIICGLDLVVINTPVVVALQKFPKGIMIEWGVHRAKNLVGAWRDQLLEIMGAMGIREVRRLRDEWGRAMLQKDLEKGNSSDTPSFVGGI